MRTPRSSVGALALAVLLAPAAAPAQERPASGLPPADTAVIEGPSPAGAMARSMILPGWGQAATGSPKRGAFFLAVHAGNIFMITKTQGRLSDVRDREESLLELGRDSVRARAAEDTVLARKIANPDTLTARARSFPGVRQAANLVESREQQREDWIAFGLFWIFASGADAFVNAHLQDFPGQVRMTPLHGGGMRLRMDVPFGRRP